MVESVPFTLIFPQRAILENNFTRYMHLFEELIYMCKILFSKMFKTSQHLITALKTQLNKPGENEKYLKHHSQVINEFILTGPLMSFNFVFVLNVNSITVNAKFQTSRSYIISSVYVQGRGATIVVIIFWNFTMF